MVRSVEEQNEMKAAIKLRQPLIKTSKIMFVHTQTKHIHY